MTTAPAGVSDTVARAPSTRIRGGFAVPLVVAACSAGLGAILASVLDVSPLLASAAGAAYFCISILTLSVVLRLVYSQT